MSTPKNTPKNTHQNTHGSVRALISAELFAMESNEKIIHCQEFEFAFIPVAACLFDFKKSFFILLFPLFLYYFTLEQLAYQAGVFWGCLRRHYFKSYLPVFNIRVWIHKPPFVVSVMDIAYASLCILYSYLSVMMS